MEPKKTQRISKKGGMVVAFLIAFSVVSAAAGLGGVNSTPTVAETQDDVTSEEVTTPTTGVTETVTTEVVTADVIKEEVIPSDFTEEFTRVEIPEISAVGSKPNDVEIRGTISSENSDLSELVRLSIADKSSRGSAFYSNENPSANWYEPEVEKTREFLLDTHDSHMEESVESFREGLMANAELAQSIEAVSYEVAKEVTSAKYPLTQRTYDLNLSREEVIANAILTVSNDEYEKLCKMVMAESGFCSWEMQNGCASAAVNEAIRQNTSLWDALTYPGRFVYTANFNGKRRAVTMDDINSSVYDAVNHALLGYDVNYETIGGSYGFWAPNYCSQKTNNYFYAHVRGTCFIENVCFYHDWV